MCTIRPGINAPIPSDKAPQRGGGTAIKQRFRLDQFLVFFFYKNRTCYYKIIILGFKLMFQSVS